MRATPPRDQAVGRSAFLVLTRRAVSRPLSIFIGSRRVAIRWLRLRLAARAVTVPVDIVDIVVPSSVGVPVVAGLGDPAPFVWLQPGSQSTEILDHLTERGVDHIADGSCIMVETRKVQR